MQKVSKLVRVVFVGIGLMFIMIAMVCTRKVEVGDVVINEVCAHNSSIMEQPLYGSCDYIELYNRGEESVNLRGYGLSNRRNGMTDFHFDDCELGPGARIVVFASGNVPDVEDHLFAGFCLSDLETVYLTDPMDQIIDWVEIPVTVSDIVYARETDGAEQWMTMKGSPWARNDSVRKVLVPTDKVEAPVLSAESGFYEDEFWLSMKAEKGCKIYYTLDGSEPYLEDAVYKKELLIQDASTQENRYRSRKDLSQKEYEIPKEKVDKAVIIRAVAVDEAGQASKETKKTYFVGERFEKYADQMVVSMMVDPDDLFGYENGIYVLGEDNDEYHWKLENGGEERVVEPANYMRRGASSRRDGRVEIFSRDGSVKLQQDVGVNISGNVSRQEVKKSFRIAANLKFERAYIDFPDFQVHAMPKSLVLRNDYGMNQWIQDLAKAGGLKVGTQASEPCQLFLNGEYWGIYCVQERCSEEYVTNFTGIAPEQILLVKGSEVTTDPLLPNYSENQQEWENFQAQIQMWYDSGKDCYEEICSQIDIESYIDYIDTQAYVDNWDFSTQHNVAMWKTTMPSDQPYGDGKWRWIFYDMDYTMVDAARNTFRETGTTDYTIENDPLFMTLMRNRTFRKQLRSRFENLADDVFAYDTVKAYIEDMKDIYQSQNAKTCEAFMKERKPYAMAYFDELMQ